MSISRPSLKEIVFSTDRRIDVLFHTSNIEKYLQARAVFESFGLQVQHFKGRTEPYSEEYEAGKHALLEKAIKQILSAIGRTSVFFVEDTSLRIEALSPSDIDFPGLSVKEWFQATSFEELDAELRSHGSNRAAVVKSDIALHLPGLNRTLYFHGETSGLVAEKSPEFEESVQYPWLTPKTFNGWFIPSGANKRLGEMSFEESWPYDFRIKALVQLIDRLEEYTAALNLPPQAYSRVEQTGDSKQLPLIPQAFIVIGRTCAGKSTFGEYASSEHKFEWIEASSVVRMFQEQESHSVTTGNVSAFAEKLLQERGADVVARKILSLMRNRSGDPLVVTGFRTLEELELIRNEMPDAKVILVEASERTRFERYLKRARTGSKTSLEDFRANDESQWKFGLLRVAEDFSDIRVTNEGAIEEYRKQVDAVIAGYGAGKVSGVSDQIHSTRRSEQSQLYRCLLALEKEGRALDCGEIEVQTRETGTPIRFNNANKMLKRYPELARRLELRGERVRYQITESGRTYLRLLKPNVESRGD